MVSYTTCTTARNTFALMATPIKSVHNRQNPKPLRKNGKASTDSINHCDSTLSIRVSLSAALTAANLLPWNTRTRISGLLLLFAHIANAPKQDKNKRPGVPLACHTARSYCSQLRNPPAGVCGDPLAVLVRLGWLEVVEPAKVNFHVKSSARYQRGPLSPQGRIMGTDKETTSCVRRKGETATQRREKGLNRRFPFRQQLLVDLRLVTDSNDGRDVVDELLKSPNTRPSTRGTLTAIATREHSVKVKETGQIVTSLGSCPRPLKPLLLLGGESVALCDISSAYPMLLPRLLSDRIAYKLSQGESEASVLALRAEHGRLVEFLSEGPLYIRLCREGATAQEVKTKKIIFNMLLNAPNERSKNHRTWLAFRRHFPLCLDIIAAIKSKNHRNIGIQLRHFTAKAITAALLELQAVGIPAIPDTDCLIVRQKDKEVACHAIGRAMFEETRGVLVTVGGVRFAAENGT